MKNIALFLFLVILSASSIMLLSPKIIPQKLITSQASPTPAKIHPFSVEIAPNQSLRGTIATSSGTILWQSRIATEPAVLNRTIPLQQGEVLETKSDGRMTINFDKSVTLMLSKNTQLNLAQTLPTNLVFVQPRGTITYTKMTRSPISIKSLHILCNQVSGKMSVTVDDIGGTVTVDVASGSAKAAFNDTDAVTQVVAVNEGEQLVYDDETRTTTVK